MKAILFVFTLFTFASFGLQAQAPTKKTPKIVQTQKSQQKRIVQGVKSGELTRAETVRLQKQQKQIQRTKRAAKSDGVVTPRERRVIRREQKKASATIHRQKNDQQNR